MRVCSQCCTHSVSSAFNHSVEAETSASRVNVRTIAGGGGGGGSGGGGSSGRAQFPWLPRCSSITAHSTLMQVACAITQLPPSFIPKPNWDNIRIVLSLRTKQTAFLNFFFLLLPLTFQFKSGFQPVRILLKRRDFTVGTITKNFDTTLEVPT